MSVMKAVHVNNSKNKRKLKYNENERSESKKQKNNSTDEFSKSRLICKNHLTASTNVSHKNKLKKNIPRKDNNHNENLQAQRKRKLKKNMPRNENDQNENLQVENKVKKGSTKSLFVVKNKLDFAKIERDYVVEEKEDEYKKPKLSERALLKMNLVKQKKENSLPVQHPELEARTIFVGNVHVTVKRKEVEKLFAQFGEIECVRFRGVAAETLNMSKKEAITKKKLHPGRKSLIAYVRFKNISSVEKAVAANGIMLKGYHLRVDTALQNDQRDKNSVFIGNLPWEVSEEDIRDFFRGCGDIVNVRVVRSSVTGGGKGFAFVSFKTKDGVEMALHFKGKSIQGRPVRIQRAVKKVKEKEKSEKRPRKGKSGLSSLWKGKVKTNKMSLSFLKQDKPGGRKKVKKQQKNNDVITTSVNFSGHKIEKITKDTKKIRKNKRTKEEKRKIAIAKSLANSK